MPVATQCLLLSQTSHCLLPRKLHSVPKIYFRPFSDWLMSNSNACGAVGLVRYKSMSYVKCEALGFAPSCFHHRAFAYAVLPPIENFAALPSRLGELTFCVIE